MPGDGCALSHSTGSSLALDEDRVVHYEALVLASELVDSGRHAVDFPSKLAGEFSIRKVHGGVVDEDVEDLSLLVANLRQHIAEVGFERS